MSGLESTIYISNFSWPYRPSDISITISLLFCFGDTLLCCFRISIDSSFFVRSDSWRKSQKQHPPWFRHQSCTKLKISSAYMRMESCNCLLSPLRYKVFCYLTGDHSFVCVIKFCKVWCSTTEVSQCIEDSTTCCD